MRSAGLNCFGVLILSISVMCAFAPGENQNLASERMFPQSKGAIEKVLKTLQPSISGRLPVLEGFALPDARPLDRFQRAYYQCSVQIIPLSARGSRVRVNAKITAWYADPVSSRSGYQTLPSNGRIEADLLDQIANALGIADETANSEHSSVSASASASQTRHPEAVISAPMPRIPEGALHGSVPAPSMGDAGGSLKAQTDAAEKRETELAAEAKGLEDILQNQAHPNNLAAVKKTGTPVLQSPNAEAKILFPATAGDEFEILDVNSNWIHVRISGLSRGWIRRSSLEMPEDLSGKKQTGTTSQSAGERFRISNEQVAPFPGDWEPLRGKIVKIVTVQKANDSAKSAGSQARFQFAKALFLKQFSELTTANGPEGIVIVFDSEDGGMIAATLPTLKEWQAGSMPDEAVWRQCFFDPPELSSLGGSQ